MTLSLIHLPSSTINQMKTKIQLYLAEEKKNRTNGEKNTLNRRSNMSLTYVTNEYKRKNIIEGYI